MMTSLVLLPTLLFAVYSAASPLLHQRQDGESPCVGEPGDRCPPGTYCQGSLRPINFDDCYTLLNERVNASGDLCAEGGSCRVWELEGCRIGFCNSESSAVCRPSQDIGGWGLEGARQCEPDGGTVIPDISEWVEVYFTALLDQQEPDTLGEGGTNGGQVTERIVPIEQFRAQNGGQVLKRQSPDDDDFEVTSSRFGVTRDGTSTIVSNELPDQGQWATIEAEELSFGIEASFELGASVGFFTIFEASVGISVGGGYTKSNQRSEEERITIDCPDACGLVEYFHLYDCYEGNWQPSGEFGEACIPNDRGRYSVRCIGCASP